MERVTHDQRELQVIYLPLHGLDQDTLGELVVLRDIADSVAAGRAAVTLVTLSCGLVAILLFGSFWVFLGRVERESQKHAHRLNRTNAALSQLTVERDQAGAALRHAHTELEARVEERTAELVRLGKEAREKKSCCARYWTRPQIGSSSRISNIDFAWSIGPAPRRTAAAQPKWWG